MRKITIVCVVCHSERDIPYDCGPIEITPCPKCLQVAEQHGYDLGYKTGHKDGHAEGCENDISDMSDVVTTPDFWDCECDTNFIHSANEDYCQKCGYTKAEMPDSRVDEVEKLLGIKFNPTTRKAL